jgi:hypothetical protein
MQIGHKTYGQSVGIIASVRCCSRLEGTNSLLMAVVGCNTNFFDKASSRCYCRDLGDVNEAKGVYSLFPLDGCGGADLGSPAKRPS